MIFFFDYETTGLDERTGYLLEASIVAINGLNESIAVTSRIIQPKAHFGHDFWTEAMNDFVRDMHTGNGLLESIETGAGHKLELVEKELLGFINEFAVEDEVCTLAGSSIHFDRRWMRQWMPKLDNRFHHRMLDVSAIRIMVESNWPEVRYVPEPREGPAHRALDDACATLAEYRYYIELFENNR